MAWKSGFAMIPRAILTRRDLTQTAKLVYAAICDAMRGREGVKIGYAGIAGRIGAGRTAVVQAIVQLAQKTDLRYETLGQGSGRANLYWFDRTRPESVQVPPLQADRKTVKGVPGKRSGGCPENGLLADRKAVLPYIRQRQTKTTPPTPPEKFALASGNGKGRKARPHDRLFDLIVQLFLPSLWDSKTDRPDSEAIKKAREGGRIQRVTEMLRAKGATPDELRTRTARHQAQWPAYTCSAESVAKHWDELGEDRPTATAAGGSAAGGHRAQKRAREFD